MLKLKFHAPGTAPATFVAPPTTGKPVIRLIRYKGDEFEECVVTDPAEVWACRDNGMVNWINIDGLGDVEFFTELATRFDIHPLAMEDVFNTTQRPKYEEYPGMLFIVSHMVSAAHEEDCDVFFEQISFFLRDDVLITIQEDGDHDVFEVVRQRLRAGTGFSRTRGHDYLAYALLDAITDNYFPVLERVGDELERIEEELMDRPTRALTRDIHTTKRLLLKLRHTAWPSREVLSQITRGETSLIREDSRMFFRDCYDHSVQIIDAIESYRDLTSGLLDMYLSSLSMRTNEVMRVLTVISSIFIPLTFIAGIYGMNFENMPELKTQDGYFLALMAMAAIGIGMLFVFKKKEWL